DVVLENPPAPVSVTDQVTAADVAVDATRSADAVHRPREARPAHDQRPGHDSCTDDLVRVVDVVDERIEGPDPLREAALDRRPLGRGEDARDQVQRPRSVAPLAV